MTDKDLKHLEWIYERLIHVHNENKNYDYMRRLNEIISLHKENQSKQQIKNAISDFYTKMS